MADDSRRAREMARLEARARSRYDPRARSEIKYSIDQRPSGYGDRRFIPVRVMRMIGIPDNQSGTGRRLLKIRHAAFYSRENCTQRVRDGLITRVYYVSFRCNLNIIIVRDMEKAEGKAILPRLIASLSPTVTL